MTDRKTIAASAIALKLTHQALVLDDSDNESGTRHRRTTSVENFAEYTVPAMSDDLFKRHFRLKRETFYEVADRIATTLKADTSNVGRGQLPVDKQLLVTLQMLANQDPYRSIGNLFGISVSSAWEIVRRVCCALLQVNAEQEIIIWPSGSRAKHTIDAFESTYRFPGIIGCIDGSHIPIRAPVAHQTSYINRKGYHSILLQAVCDHDLLFTDCYVGEVGAVHDAAMFRRSDLHSRISADPHLFPYGSHMVGDAAYPLLTCLMVPFKDDGRLDTSKHTYNCTLSRARSSIERAFALLKARFRRLKYVDMKRTQDIPLVVMACCILHNMCTRCGDLIDVDDGDGDGEQGHSSDSSGTHPRPVAKRHEAVVKREEICKQLERHFN